MRRMWCLLLHKSKQSLTNYNPTLTTEISNYNDLVNTIAPAFAVKKFFDEPLANLLDFLLPGQNEWNALSELIGKQDGLKGILKKKMDLHWLTYKTGADWNAADKAFIEALYSAVKNS